MFEDKIQQVRKAETISYTGKIENIVGMSIEASGGRAAVGDICQEFTTEESGGQVLAEVVGFKNDRMLLMPYSDDERDLFGKFCPQYRPQAEPDDGSLSQRAGD